MYNYSDYEQYAVTDTEKRNLKLFIKHGSVNAAAKASGISRNTLKSSWRRIRDRAALKTFAPECGIVNKVPDVMNLKGMSDMRTNSEGKPVWYKYDVDLQKKAEVMRQVLEAFKEDLPTYEPVQKPDFVNADLINHFTLTDTHIGDWASMATSGADWDLKVAEKVICGAMFGLIEESPKAHTAILSLLGDIVHFDDGINPKTPKSQHALDASGTIQTIAPVVVRVLRRVIDRLLLTHDKVVISIVRGNHDEGSTPWIKALLMSVYEDEGRIEFIEGDIFYQAFLIGDNFFGMHHGDKKKPTDLPLIFATRYPNLWGKANHRFFHSGDKHHKMVKDVQGNKLIQHETLCAPNRYSSNGGYDSERGATRYTYHMTHGYLGDWFYSVDRLGV